MPSPRRRFLALRVSAALLVTLAAQAAAGASLFDPALRFRELRTTHFTIYFHQGEAQLAVRLAAVAESSWLTLRGRLGSAMPPHTHVVLVDQSELANGYATPVPYNTIVINAVWPAAYETIGYTDDWLRLVFTHEFTHIVHLDRSESWARGVRQVFGRATIAFPNLFLPEWQIEGIATYEEGLVTGKGRLHAGDFRLFVDEAARTDRLEPLDRVNGGLIDWPGGEAHYAYGLGFHEYLAARFGADSLGALADGTARSIPYSGSRVFRDVYGESLGDLWRDYERGMRSSPRGEQPGGPNPVQLTHHGFVVTGPRFARPRCAECPLEIIYSVQNPHGFPELDALPLDASRPRRLTTRYLGSTAAIGADVVYFDQQEIRRNTGVYSDLYALDRASGRVQRLTSEARLLDPDLSPDGRTLACVQNAPGRRDLVTVPIGAGGMPSDPKSAARPGDAFGVRLASGAETQFNGPKWSPDGRTIAVERHEPGRNSEIVVIDVSTLAVRTLAAYPSMRFTTPAWRPDGQAVIAAGAPANGVFNLYEFPIAGSTPRQLTHLDTGATWPDVSPDGRTIVFVGYTTAGYDLFQIPYPSEVRPRDIPEPATPPVQTGKQDVANRGPRDYSPWPTLRPTSWAPSILWDSSQVRAGAIVNGSDVLGYHNYSVAATWLLSAPSGAPTSNTAVPDWNVFYAYSRWRPTLFAATSTETSFFAGPPAANGLAPAATLREREVQAGLLFPVLHTRAAHTALASVVRASDDFILPDGEVTRDRTAVRGGWQTATAHIYGYSISPEEGMLAGATVEVVPRGLGSFADATVVTGDARAYLPSLAAHHVIAVRLAGGASNGDPAVGRTFLLGGASPNSSPIDFGHEAISLLRGFPPDTFGGSRVALFNADYRWPIVRPQRGLGTWPIFLRTLHAAVFADAGNAWTRSFSSRDIKTSFGAELSLDVIAGYVWPFTFVMGAARGHDGAALVADRTELYFRIGRAF